MKRIVFTSANFREMYVGFLPWKKIEFMTYHSTYLFCDCLQPIFSVLFHERQSYLTKNKRNKSI